MRQWPSLLALVAAAPALADLPDLTCRGTAPNWTLELTATAGTLVFRDQTSVMAIMQHTRAEGADWPRAMTLAGPRDSAIVILQRRRCNSDTHEAQVLTQRGTVPLMLTGCCAATP